jgi:hypothetical protein
MHVYGQAIGCTLVLMAFVKMLIPWTLLETVIKCCTSKNNTFLIAFQSTTVTAKILFRVTTATLRQSLIAQYVGTEITHRLAIEPIAYGHGSNVILLI